MAKHELNMAEKKIYDMEFHGSMTRWIRVGDKTTKEFFCSKGPRHARTMMRNLNREDGDEMRNIATSYYQCLLTEDTMATEEDIREDIILQSIPEKVKPEMNTWLVCPLSIIEIWEALSDLHEDSCPRIDGLTPHFFTCLWDTIKEDLLQAYEEIITFGNMSEEFGQGMIHLIPKSRGSANDISKWRPITLLNIVYKLLAKIVARRLTPLLPQLIHPS